MDTIEISVNVNEFVYRRSFFNLNYRKKILVEDFKSYLKNKMILYPGFRLVTFQVEERHSRIMDI